MKPLAQVEAFAGIDLFPTFAHQGGWDEILLVAIPLVSLALLLVLANRRVDAKLRNQSDQTNEPSDS